MSVLWILPLVVVAAGATLVASAARRTAHAAGTLRDECARLGELREALCALRADARRAHERVDHLRDRSAAAVTQR